jgi:hypothetical protein
MVDRETPPNWVWAYHVTPQEFLVLISKVGLRPTMHPHVSDVPVIFVEPDIEGVEPYYREGMAVLRFKTPGFGTTDDGENVIFGGSEPGSVPDDPLVGRRGADGVVPPERIQVLADRTFRWLIQ